jgi:predicted dinucleotide-binding enzyme
MKIAFIGHGKVGGALANGLQKLGHTVTLAVRDAASASVKEAQARNPALLVAAPEQAVKDADVVFLATPFQAAADVLKTLSGPLAGKVLVDCTNPVGPGLAHGLGSQQSGTEMLQALVPGTRVVKAFTIYGFENFEHTPPPSGGIKPAMMFCGNDGAAKATVGGLIRELGWEPVDVGGAVQALHLEHMTLLWVRMVRMGGHPSSTVWAVLPRA